MVHSEMLSMMSLKNGQIQDDYGTWHMKKLFFDADVVLVN